RINAAGRMEDAMLALELLMSDNRESADPLAQRLQDQNSQRQQLTAEIVREAKLQVVELDNAAAVIVMGATGWPLGVLGLAASRLNGDAFSRPIRIEASAAFADLKPSLHHEIQMLAPFGVGNREPLLLSREAEIVRTETFGADRRHLRLHLRDRTASAEAIAFDKAAAAPHLPAGRRLDVVYALQFERWAGLDRLRLHLRDP